MNGNLNFSGVRHFWQIHDILSTDNTPDKCEWDALFNTPGYQVLVESEYSVELLKNLLLIALKPSRKADVKRIKKQYQLNMIKHYQNVSANREMLIKYEKKLKTGNYLHDAIKLCLEYLPIKEVNGTPPICFLYFDNDARGYSPIVIDLLAIKNLGDQLYYFIAHEAHHYYRNRDAIYDYDNVPDEYKKLVRVLNQIQMEGIADCIDKPQQIKTNSDSIKKYLNLVREAPDYLALLEATVIDLYRQLILPDIAGSILNDRLPWSGHPIGYYMSQVILSAGKKVSMVNSCYNCFDFFELYNQAADGGSYRFNKEFIAALRRIEKDLFS